MTLSLFHSGCFTSTSVIIHLSVTTTKRLTKSSETDQPGQYARRDNANICFRNGASRRKVWSLRYLEQRLKTSSNYLTEECEAVENPFIINTAVPCRKISYAFAYNFKFSTCFILIHSDVVFLKIGSHENSFRKCWCLSSALFRID